MGAGPRATPALANGRVYALGATGILNALDAGSGASAWSRNAAHDTDTEVPEFGITSSPLVVDRAVVVATAGTLVAYDATTGELLWIGPPRSASYSSPHLVSIDGIEQILLLNGGGLTSVEARSGALLWEHPWPGLGIVQPASIANGEILIAALGPAGSLGTRRLTVRRGPDGWAVDALWTSTSLRPTLSALVVHEGHAFSFDGRILACIDLETGKRRWKGGRYGSGQLLLLPDQDLLLVLSERGELALVSATPERFTELGRFPAIEGKTWSQPAFAGEVVLVRNRETMAAFRLPFDRN